MQNVGFLMTRLNYITAPKKFKNMIFELYFCNLTLCMLFVHFPEIISYSVQSYLYESSSGLIRSVGEERANLSAISYL